MEYLPSEAATGQATTNTSLGASAATDENMVAVLEDFNLAAGAVDEALSDFADVSSRAIDDPRSGPGGPLAVRDI